MKPATFISTTALVVTTALLSLFGEVASASSCAEYTNCTSCAADNNCMWVLLYNCQEKCIEKEYKDPNGIKARNVIWRSSVENEAQCPSKEECEIMEGDVPNPSFEDWEWRYFSKKEREKNDATGAKGVTGVTEHPPWNLARIVSVKNCTTVYNPDIDTCMKSYPVGIDGNFFLFMGGSQRTQTYEVRLDNMLRISKGATHLSFFYALPYYSKLFSLSSSSFINRTALDVFIDNEHVFRLSNINMNATMYRDSDAYYHPMNINISKFADGKNHSLMFYFTEAIEGDGYTTTTGQVIIVDYVQVIKSNLNGNTFDGWEGAPFDSESSCEKYCLPKYIGDGVCDRVCMTKGCNNDGGDCGYDMSLSNEAIIGIVAGIAGGLIIVGIIVLIVLINVGVLNFQVKRSGGIEMGTEAKKPKKWSVNTKNIMFGGKEAEIGIALKDTLTVENHGKSRSFKIGLFDEDRCGADMKFKVVIKPKEFQLDKGEEQTVNIFVKIFCTTTISEQIEILTTDSSNERETVNFVASGKKSTRINPYDLMIGDPVGEGSFGVVYRGIYKNACEVAVKKLIANDENSIKDFNNESDILEKINSEYTVKFYGALVTDDYYCFVTEFIKFGALSKSIPSIANTDSNGGKRILCALNIAKGLEYLHCNNIIYRDLKPENVLVSNINIDVNCSGIPVVCKLTDFGTSKVLDKGSENMTKKVGTPLYMAPEVILSDTYGQESDIYSFGSSFVELWLGYHPNENTGLNYVDFIRKVADGSDPLRFNPRECYPEIHKLVNRCLEYDPKLRPGVNEIINVLFNHWSNVRQGTPNQLF